MATRHERWPRRARLFEGQSMDAACWFVADRVRGLVVVIARTADRFDSARGAIRDGRAVGVRGCRARESKDQCARGIDDARTVLRASPDKAAVVRFGARR